MDEMTRSEIDKILKNFESNTKERERKMEERKQEKEQFKKEYMRVKSDVIRPTMDDGRSGVIYQGIGSYL
jgi:hypothetical protein